MHRHLVGRQGIASMSHILPKAYLDVFKQLHDQAPAVSHEDVDAIFLQEVIENHE